MPKSTLRTELHASILDGLRKERVRKGLSMMTVAERAGLNQSAISLLERGLRSPNLDTLLRIAEALETDLAELIGTAAKEVTGAKRSAPSRRKQTQ